MPGHFVKIGLGNDSDPNTVAPDPSRIFQLQTRALDGRQNVVATTIGRFKTPGGTSVGGNFDAQLWLLLPLLGAGVWYPVSETFEAVTSGAAFLEYVAPFLKNTTVDAFLQLRKLTPTAGGGADRIDVTLIEGAGGADGQHSLDGYPKSLEAPMKLWEGSAAIVVPAAPAAAGPIIATQRAVQSFVLVAADLGNTANVELGDKNLTFGNGQQLAKGDSTRWPTADASLLYCISNAEGQKLRVTYF